MPFKKLIYSLQTCPRNRGKTRLVNSTIYGHLEQAIQAGEPVGINRLLPPDQQAQIAAAFAQTGFGNLTGAKELLGDLCDYGQLRIFRALHGKKPHE